MRTSSSSARGPARCSATSWSARTSSAPGAGGDYLPGRSDLDVALVVRAALDADEKAGVADAFRVSVMPCPAPRLELVVYRADIVRSPGTRPAFELNLNTGAATIDSVSLDPVGEPWFWFLLDLDAAADAARAVEGAPPDEVFGSAPRAAVLEALAASLAWHAAHEEVGPNRVLNACRAWCWVVTDEWRSKAAAAGWAIEAGADAALANHAASLRDGSRTDPLARHRVVALDRRVAGMVQNERA